MYSCNQDWSTATDISVLSVLCVCLSCWAADTVPTPAAATVALSSQGSWVTRTHVTYAPIIQPFCIAPHSEVETVQA